MKERIRNYISNPYLQFGLLVLPLIIALIAWRFPVSDYKALKVGILVNVQPINISEGVKKDRLEIFFGGQKVENLSYIKFRISNTGTEPLIKSDFISDLALKFPEGTQILDYSSTFPSYNTASLTAPNTLSLGINLLNEDEAQDIEVLLQTGTTSISASSISLTGGIVGINSLPLEEMADGDLLTKKELKIAARKDLTNGVLFIVALAILVVIGGLVAKIVGYKGENWIIKLISKGLAYLFVAAFATYIVGAVGAIIFVILRTIYYAI